MVIKKCRYGKYVKITDSLVVTFAKKPKVTILIILQSETECFVTNDTANAGFQV